MRRKGGIDRWDLMYYIVEKMQGQLSEILEFKDASADKSFKTSRKPGDPKVR